MGNKYIKVTKDFTILNSDFRITAIKKDDIFILKPNGKGYQNCEICLNVKVIHQNQTFFMYLHDVDIKEYVNYDINKMVNDIKNKFCLSDEQMNQYLNSYKIDEIIVDTQFRCFNCGDETINHCSKNDCPFKVKLNC